ncbi:MULTISPECIES: sigma-54-dependent transcriptional regulator [Dyella]|nr:MULTISPECIES: sigma-54 dependent transcriptional regulator [Dyella]
MHHSPLYENSMPLSAPTILLVDDDASYRNAAAAHATLKGCKVIPAATYAEAQAAASAHEYDLALVDLDLPDGNGLDLLNDIALARAGQAVVVTAFPTMDTAVRAVKSAAIDYLIKPIRGAQLNELFDRAIASAAQRQGEPEPDKVGALIGKSGAMRHVFAAITRVASTDATVLISGESGTGKELAARALHELSGRKGDFVAVNCGAVAHELLPSELFGHARGSFTGAIREHAGFFEQAQGGTLFLDEFTEMPLALQTHLLRVLEERKITRVGADKSRSIDVRVIAACNRDPFSAVQEGMLRSDLYYRLMDFPIHMPPLRERVGDIALLAAHFLRQLNQRYAAHLQFAPGTLESLERYAWPGNVRELRHRIQRAFVLAEDVVDLSLLPPPPGSPGRDSGALNMEVGMTLEQVERRMLMTTLAHYGYDKVRAAQVLGISTKTIYNKLARYAASDEATRRT